jgi:hypothetical protein
VMVFLLKLPSSPSRLVLESTGASMPPVEAGVGRRKVKVWLQPGKRRRGQAVRGLGLPFR